jgi:hypothetical protein
MIKNTAVNLGVWVALVVFTAIGMTLMNRSSLPSGTMKSTEGSVVGYMPGEHPSYRYSYLVNGRPFQGSARLTERAEQMKLGGTVTVFYDEADPGNSTLAQPSTVLVKRVGLIVAASVVIPVLLMWLLQARRLLPPWKLFEDCRRWVVLRFTRAKSPTQTTVKTSQMPAAPAK